MSHAEEHASETSRTAKELAEEVTRLAAEETEKNVRNQQEALRRMAETFDQFADGQRMDMNGRPDDRQRHGNGQERQQAEGRVAGAAAHQASQQQGAAKQQAGRKDS